MAKPRKPKNEDAKPENSGAVVRHQKLCLSIDIDKHQIYGSVSFFLFVLLINDSVLVFFIHFQFLII
jgi:hypothetical protein